ncbi:hypothetical protein NLG97_g5293 [Lecanicillium saksenae]|uniref:Uncharacterized protein n=1 Tax=Lecanicillium saksenae TaxID=468837 RepID=A0ACC1QTF6_9HYPO|nr:hypothetical protein NLG97_g5293 [Lecanicillium saksenae]
MTEAVPGATWVTATALQPTTNKLHGTIVKVLATANFAHLENVAIQSRCAQSAESGAAISCEAKTDAFTFGMNNLVLKLVFSDGVSWIARISHSAEACDRDAEEAATSMLSEIATLHTLRKRTTIPVPDVFAFDASKENEFTYSYMLMECLRGHARSTATHQVPLEYRPHVTNQLADLFFQLENLSFNKLGRLWCGKECDEAPSIIPYVDWHISSRPATSLVWFYNDRQRQNRAAIAAHTEDPEWRAAYWILKTAISQIIIEDRIHSPFPLCHFDLHYGNLLFDDDYNLTGGSRLDQRWYTAPLERLAVTPEFITFPGNTVQANEIILDFRTDVRENPRVLESQSSLVDEFQTNLSAVLGTKRADIVHRCTYSFPHRALWDGRLVAKLIYNAAVSWKQLVATFGQCELF